MEILQSTSELEFKNGKLTSGSQINVGLGTLSSSGDLIIDDNASVILTSMEALPVN